MRRVYLIAELGSCHDGDWAKVQQLVALCSAARFSACKLQFWSDSDELAARRNATPEYRAIYHRHRTPLEWLPLFSSLCHLHGIDAVVSCYLHKDVEVAAKYADRLKIASFEHEDAALIDAAVATGKPVIVSLGMYVYRGEPRTDCAYLGCVSAYPAPLDGALHGIYTPPDDMRMRPREGYSDHTRNVWTGAVAVGCGAQILEVHVRLDETDPANPDYATALTPDEFTLYAQGVRTAERLIADVPVDESAMRKFKVRPI